jgi:hypothetical protein
MEEPERPKALDNLLGNMLGELYRSRYEQQFENHPNKDEIVEHLVKGDSSIEQIELWFAEATRYTWKKIMEAPRPKPDKDGNVTFQIYKGE